MIIVDTSVWTEHLKKKNPTLVKMLENELVASHEIILGELALSTTKQRMNLLELAFWLPTLESAEMLDVVEFIEVQRLHGKGLGLNDCHILFAAYTNGLKVYTHDAALAKEAKRIGVAYTGG